MPNHLTPAERAAVVQRYEQLTQGRVRDFMVKHQYGEWMKYNDHEAAVIQTRRLALEEAAKVVDRLCPCCTPSDWGQGIRAAHRSIKDALDRLAREGEQ
jgi:hypothetical protein